MTSDNSQGVGALVMGAGAVRFRVWAPLTDRVAVRLLGSARSMRLEPTERGYHEAVLEDVMPGERYFFNLAQGRERPDPASRCQPQGVHGPSEVVDWRFSWDERGWSGIPLADYVIYELHVGTFTPQGTFEAAIPFLDYLAGIGVTAVELMPVAQFPGERNWGYDGVYPFAAQHSYGGPTGLKTLVDACHQRRLAVILDVVYNHLGPEGNYLNDFAPYFTDAYKSPWGPALNFDGPYSDEVRHFFIENALYWLRDCHVDALRLDAVHAILDHSPYTFLEELQAAVQSEAARLQRRIYLIAESADNNPRLLHPRARGGYELDAQWNDDFHHCLRTLLTGERSGYYADYGEFSQLAKAYREGFAYSGEYSKFRKRRHGSTSRDVPARKFVVFAQNHDQIGNRMLGDRLTQAVSFDDLKLAAGLVLLSPSLPLLFMGEEYGENAPFPFFVSHSDAELVRAVREGRRAEFVSFNWQGEVPDPQAEETFMSAKLDHRLRETGNHKVLLDFYRELLRLRKSLPAIAETDKESMTVTADSHEKTLAVERWRGSGRALVIANLGATEGSIVLGCGAGRWRKLLDSAAPQWRGAGSALPEEFAGLQDCRLSLGARALALYFGEECT